MGNYSLIDIFLLLGIGQGIFLCITLIIIHNKNIAANKILAVQLLISCVTLFNKIVIHKANEIWIVQRLATLEALIFVFGPLGYIYLKRLLEKNQKQFKLPWFHYIPAFIYLAFLLHANTYSSEEFNQKLISGGFKGAFFIAELSALLFNIYYWCISTFFFIKVLKKEKEQLSFKQSMIPFVKFILIISGIILFVWVISFFCTYIIHTMIPIINYNLIWTLLPLLIYVIAFFALKQPEIFRIVVIDNKSKGKSRELMSEQSSKELQQKLTELIHNEKIYLDNELTLVELSKQLNTSTNNVSWLLNTVYKSNFYDFINTYRINEFVTKLEQDEHKLKTLLSLSMEVGFNSKSTFNKAFKAVLKETPSSYIRKLAG